MSNINVNDIVRIGGGKVHYRVESITDGKAFVIGEKSSRSVDIAKLVVVEPAKVTEEVTEEVSQRLDASFTESIEALADTLPNGTFLVIDGEETEYKSFESAAFHLSRNHTYLFAAIVVDGVVKAKRERVMQ